MPDIQRTVFGLLLLMHQSCSVALPERWTPKPIMPSSTLPHLLKDWNYPYTKDIKCTFPYIWQASVGRCCYPVFNCRPGYGIEFCSLDRGNDSCVECKNSYKQYYLVHSFDGVNATCFLVNRSDEEECIHAIKEETLPARGNFVASCGLPCECNASNCFHGDDPCRCQLKQEKCKLNEQMNRLTGACEACPWYSYKLNEGCEACLVNTSLWMSGSSKVLVPPSTPNRTVWVTTTGYLPNSTTEETNTRTTTALLPETKNNTPIQTGVIIVVIVGVICATVVVIAVFLIKRKLCHARSGASSSQYTSISQGPFPTIAVANQGPASEYQGESESSHLINNIPETNIQQSNGYNRQQSVSGSHHHFDNHKVADDMDSPKSSESSNDLGAHGYINERKQSALSNNKSPEYLTEPREGTHQNENMDIRNRQENPAEQMEPSNNLGKDLGDLQTGSNAVQIRYRKTDNQNKGRDIVNENQNIVHAEVTDPPSSILFSSDSNNPCSSSHVMDKNLDGRKRIFLGTDIGYPDYFGERGSPVENSHCWSYPRDGLAYNDSLTDAQTLSGYEDIAQNTVPQAICTGDVDKRTDDNISKIQAKEFTRLLPLIITANRGIHLGTPNQESRTCSEDSRIPNEEPRIHSEEGHPQSPQYSTMPLSLTSASNSSPFRYFLNRSISSSAEDDVAQNTVPQAMCTGDVDNRTDEHISKLPQKEVVRVLPLTSSANRDLHHGTPNQESGTCSEDSRIPNEEPRIHSEEGSPQSPQYSTMPLSPTSASNSSPFRPFLNRSISSADRPTAKVPPMRQETRSQRQDEVTVENDDSISTDSSTDISMAYGVVHFAGGASNRDGSLESSNPSLSSCCEDAPPSFSYSTNPMSIASHTQMENTGPRRTGGLRSATRNGSQIQMMASQSRGGPDGASVPSHHQVNRTMEPRQVFETEVKERQQSEETDPKTLLRSTLERDRNELERQDSDCEDDPEKIGCKVNIAEDQEKLRDICVGLVYPGNPSDTAENSSDEVQGKTSRKDFHAMGANASHKEINLRNVPLHNDDQVRSFSSDLEHEESKLNSTARSILDTEETSTSNSYNSLQDKEDNVMQMETKGVEDSGKDGSFQDSKSSLKEIKKEGNNFFSDTDPVVDESSSELEHEENKLNSAAKSRLDTEETSDSYRSLQNKEDVNKATKSLENVGKDGGFRDSKSSQEEVEKEAEDFVSDTDPVVDESSSDQRSSHSEDEGVCSNGDAELNRELQEPSRGQIDVHNEFNSSSLSVNSDESGIDIEEQAIQNLQDR